jgi:hypothetical protein
MWRRKTARNRLNPEALPEKLPQHFQRPGLKPPRG